MQRLDSMTLPELTKISRKSSSLFTLGIIFIIISLPSIIACLFLHADLPPDKPEHAVLFYKLGYYSGAFSIPVLLFVTGSMLAFLRTRSARIFLFFFSSISLLTILAFACSAINDLGGKSIGVLIVLCLPLLFIIWTFIGTARSGCLFGPDA